ncbi:MAG: hypothetical protein KC442_14900 [Thermomicrobiales bacterium]|nr:hypothetical protein [Thermomicrobiales bacterium]
MFRTDLGQGALDVPLNLLGSQISEPDGERFEDPDILVPLVVELFQLLRIR